MKTLFFFSACFIGFLATVYAAKPVSPGCFEKEKALTLLETAENLLSKAKDSFPSCNEDANTTDESECGWKKPLAYIEISKKLISDVRQNFPTCPKPVEKEDKTVKEDKIVKEEKFSDCSEVLASGHNKSGVFTIWSEEPFTTGKSLKVYCDMDTDKGAWTVIQRRGEFRVQQDFFQDWETYKNGFGNLTEEFWLGNENIRLLCQNGCEIRFDLQDKNGAKGYALYKNFKLSNGNYRISISDYTGNIGDSMSGHNNLDFSTKDKENFDKVKFYKGGWWYRSEDYFSNLNGIFTPGKSDFENVFWYTWRQKDNLARVEIKLRKK